MLQLMNRCRISGAGSRWKFIFQESVQYALQNIVICDSKTYHMCCNSICWQETTLRSISRCSIPTLYVLRITNSFHQTNCIVTMIVYSDSPKIATDKNLTWLEYCAKITQRYQDRVFHVHLPCQTISKKTSRRPSCILHGVLDTFHILL